jgi:hypothetical protein
MDGFDLWYFAKCFLYPARLDKKDIVSDHATGLDDLGTRHVLDAAQLGSKDKELIAVKVREEHSNRHNRKDKSNNLGRALDPDSQ